MSWDISPQGCICRDCHLQIVPTLSKHRFSSLETKYHYKSLQFIVCTYIYIPNKKMLVSAGDSSFCDGEWFFWWDPTRVSVKFPGALKGHSDASATGTMFEVSWFSFKPISMKLCRKPCLVCMFLGFSRWFSMSFWFKVQDVIACWNIHVFSGGFNRKRMDFYGPWLPARHLWWHQRVYHY